MAMKIQCRKCKEIKDSSGFYGPYEGQYMDKICRNCKNEQAKARAKKKREEDPEGSREKSRANYIKYRETILANLKKPEIRARACKNKQRTRQNDRLRDHPHRKAREKTREAVRKGELKKTPCQKCGDVAVEAHHPDYTAPLQVVWLCRACHWEEHRL